MKNFIWNNLLFHTLYNIVGFGILSENINSHSKQ